MNHTILILFSILMATSLNAATVYKTVDAEGNVIFSDTASEGAEKIEVKKAPAISLPTPKYDISVTETKQKKIVYEQLQIVSPINDDTIHDNQGNVQVKFELSPALIDEHQLVLFLDGKEVKTGNATPFTLTNIDRGTHSVKLAVRDQDGKLIKQSNNVIYHLRRTSVLTSKKDANNTNSVTPLNPPKTEAAPTPPPTSVPAL